LTKFCRKSELSLSFSSENTAIDGTNLRPAKAVRGDWQFLSLPQIEKLHY